MSLIIFSRYLVFYIYSSKDKYNIESKLANAIIYGAGTRGIELLKQSTFQSKYNLLCFIDDDPNKHGKIISNKIIYNRDKILQLIKDFNVDTIIITISEIESFSERALLGMIKDTSVKIKYLPTFNELIRQNKNDDNKKSLSMEDILNRKSCQNWEVKRRCFINKTILITGAGGSIGSELSQQLMPLGSSKIILVDNNEYNLYQIDRKLNLIKKNERTETEIKAFLYSIQNKEALNSLFKNFKPDIIFHVAAFKHVNMIENNIINAIQNNFIATCNIIDLAIDYSSSEFVLVSTDKAVKPSTIMGATKRLAEMYSQLVSKKNHKTKISVVRFGNVINSSGSVIPLFKEQIANGGPVTVTHKDVERYFMSIPEAVGLILDTSELSLGGEIFILEMGKPIKILDLAKKMINLFNKSDSEIEIIFTGLKRGEKITEILSINNDIISTKNKSIYISKDEVMNEEKFYEIKEKLLEAVYKFDGQLIKEILKSNKLLN